MGLSDYIPTDNLYKFIAISGLIICGFALAAPYKALNENNLENHKISIQLNVLKLEVEYLKKDANDFKTEHENLLQDMKGLEKEIDKEKEQTMELTEEQKNYYKNIALELKEKSDLIIETAIQIGQKNLALAIKLEEIKGRKKINGYLLKIIKQNLIYFYFTMIIGLIMIFVGFYLWYFRLQVYQDRRVKYERGAKI